ATPWLRAFSSDGDWLAVSTDSGVLKAVPTTSDRPPSLLPGHERAARFLRFLPDSPLLVSVTDIDLRTWNVEQPTLTMLQGHDSYVYDLSVSPDGRSVASAAWDGTVRTWDLTTTRAAHVLQFDGQREPYGLVAHSPDGGLLATTHSFEARLWNSATGELLHRLPFSPPIDPDTGRIVDSWYLHQPIAIAWHPSGTWFAVGSGGRPLQAWSVGGPRDDLRVEPLSWPVHGNALAFSPDGRWLAASVGHYDAPATVELWSLSERRRVSTLTGPRSRVAELDFSPDSRQLAAAVEDGTVRTWSVPEGEPGLVLRAHPERAYSVAWSPDGRRLATGANDDDLRLWDPATGRELLRLQGHSDYIHALAWDPSGNFLISGSGDGDLRIWGTRALRERHAASSGPR
ncbi:MAG: WD40 repeat domain-containing protein, partial [Acidobacteriota bacterium]